MAKHKDEEFAILALLLLGLLGRGPWGGGSSGGTDMGTGTGMGDSSSGKSSGGDSTSTNTDNTSVGTKSGSSNVDLSTGGSPDKGRTIGPMGTMPMPPTYMPPANVANLINPNAPTGGTPLGPNNLGGTNFFLPGLSLFGYGMGGPGPGPNTPSITTVYGNNTYTNFNPALLNAMPTDKSNAVTPEIMVKTPLATPPMYMPMSTWYPIVSPPMAPQQPPMMQTQALTYQNPSNPSWVALQNVLQQAMKQQTSLQVPQLLPQNLGGLGVLAPFMQAMAPMAPNPMGVPQTPTVPNPMMPAMMPNPLLAQIQGFLSNPFQSLQGLNQAILSTPNPLGRPIGTPIIPGIPALPNLFSPLFAV